MSHRRRFSHAIHPRTTALSAALLVLLLLTAAAMPSAAQAATPEQASAKGLDYLHAQWRDNGGFSPSSSTGDLGSTPWAIMAISAAGYDPSTWMADGNDLVTLLRDADLEQEAERGSGSNNTPAFYAKLILAFTAAGRPDLAVLAGNPSLDLVSTLLSYQDAADGRFRISAGSTSADISTTIWATLALAAAGRSEDAARAAQWLSSVQGENGGFAFQSSSAAATDVDDTGAAVQALLAAGVDAADPAVTRALDYLRSSQLPDGGFLGWGVSNKSTAESTSWAVQAILAAGGDPSTWTTSEGANPISYLLALQQADGCFAHYQGQVATPVMTTTQAIIALCGRPFPVTLTANAVAPDYVPILHSFAPTAGAQLPSGAFEIVASFADNTGGTGLDQARIHLKINGAERQVPANSATTGGFTLVIDDLGAGQHSLSLTIGDLAGHTLTQESTISVAATTTTTTTTTRRVTYVGGTGSGGGGTSGGSTRPARIGTPSGYDPLGYTTSTARTRIGTDSAGHAQTRAGEAMPLQTNDGLVAGTAMQTPEDGTFGEADGGDIAVTGQKIPEDEGEGKAATGLLVGGIVALLPLGALLSQASLRKRTSLLGSVFQEVGAVLPEDDPDAPVPPADVTAARDQAAWVQFQGRLRHRLAHLPLPD